MSDSDRAVAVDDAVRDGLAAVDTASLTVCLFGSQVEVVADETLGHVVAVATETVAAKTTGTVDVTVVVADETVDVRITATDADTVSLDADDAGLAYVHRYVDRHDGAVTAVADGVVIRLLRART